ncbi:MAG: alpha/beta fold hydrolase [Spirochaetaceae bacterium]|nr:MAG: alpha/beta fold hydrolase [Spirochaetaceae bacterium]
MFDFEGDVKYLMDQAPQMAKRVQNSMDIMEGKYANKRGVTPYEVVYRRNRFRILRYVSDHPKRFKTPLVFCYALINKYYVLDLTEEKSFVRFLLESGWDVYMIDWGKPSKIEGQNGFYEYIERYMARGINKILELTGQTQINLFGYCLGSIMSMVYTAVHQDKVKNLIVLTPPVDFSDDGVLTAMSRSDYFDPTKIAEHFGHLIPPELIHGGFKFKDALGNITTPYTLWKILWNEKALQDYFAMNNWVDDNVPIAASFWSELVTKMYKQNAMMNNTFRMGSIEVDFKNINCPMLSIGAEKDNIVTPECAEGAGKITSSKDFTFMLKKGGHIGVITGNMAKRELWPDVQAWLSKRSERITVKKGALTAVH